MKNDYPIYYSGLGGVKQVTGSHSLFTMPDARILFDAGVAQGRDMPTMMDFAGQVDSVLCSHTHADHLGDLVKIIVGNPDIRAYIPYGTLAVAMLVLEDSQRNGGNRRKMKDVEADRGKCLKAAGRIEDINRQLYAGKPMNRKGCIRETTPHRVLKEQEGVFLDEIEMLYGQIDSILGPYAPRDNSLEAVYDAIELQYTHRCQAMRLQGVMSQADVNAVRGHLRQMPIGEWQPIFGEADPRDIAVRLENSGHLTTILATQALFRFKNLQVLCSGDLGPFGLPPPYTQPTIKPLINQANVLLLESTYGDRERPNREEELRKFLDTLADYICRRVDCIIPILSQERPTVTLYELLRGLAERVPRDAFQILLYGTLMGNMLSEVPRDHPMWQRIRGEFRYIGRSDIGMFATKHHGTPSRIGLISGGFMHEGMPSCRVLEQAMKQRELGIFITHYPGGPEDNARLMLEGKPFSLMPKNQDVVLGNGHRAYHFQPFSGHADQPDLVRYAEAVTAPSTKGNRTKILVNHGSKSAGLALEKVLNQSPILREKGVQVILPEQGETIRLQ